MGLIGAFTFYYGLTLSAWQVTPLDHLSVFYHSKYRNYFLKLVYTLSPLPPPMKISSKTLRFVAELVQQGPGGALLALPGVAAEVDGQPLLHDEHHPGLP